MSLGSFAGAVGRGLFAGLAGTVAITLSQSAEMALRDRPASTAPADAAGKVLGVAPTGDAEKQRFAQIVHFGYGTGWGVVRALLGVLGLRGSAATLTHFVAIYGTSLVMLPALGVAPPATEWGAEELAVEAWHHLVYAAAAGEAYDRMGTDNQKGARS